jgi:hypothetical protein
MLAFADGWFTSYHVEIESLTIANTKIELVQILLLLRQFGT